MKELYNKKEKTVITDKPLSLVVDMFGCPNRCWHCWIGHMPNRKMDEDSDILISIMENL